MALPWAKRGDHAQSYELVDPHTPINPDGLKNSNQRVKSHSLDDQDDQDETTYKRNVSVVSPSQIPRQQTFGKPTVKKRFNPLHFFAATCSLICMIIAIAAVANEEFSWRLGVDNYQLIVLGFLLGIMQLCLVSVTPTLFLLLEARFGPSTLQNYEGILRNQVLATGLSFVWRFFLVLMVVLPLGLSVAYKTFTGGESVKSISARDYALEASTYGMFAPPGLLSVGQNTGVSLFFNATVDYIATSSVKDAPEPAFATRTRATGFNVLSLDKDRTALLDIPEPGYVSQIQDLLASGESWNITASVFGTVATFDTSRQDDLQAYEKDIEDVCMEAKGTKAYGNIRHAAMLNGYAVDLVTPPSPGNQSFQYISLSADPEIDLEPPCGNFSRKARRYGVTRHPCAGTWTTTRGDIQLVDGSCEETLLPPEKQQPITQNTKDLFLALWYMPSLVEFLGPFATDRNGSEWQGSYFATAIATMLWSRIVAANSATTQTPTSTGFSALHHEYNDITYQDAGLIYRVDDHVLYRRPTLRKSPLLYLVLVIEPFLTVAALALSMLLYSTPVDKNFGPISILSGIDRSSLDILAGATLSGKLNKPIMLVMQPRSEDGVTKIEYQVMPPTARGLKQNGRLDSRKVYH